MLTLWVAVLRKRAARVDGQAPAKRARGDGNTREHRACVVVAVAGE